MALTDRKKTALGFFITGLIFVAVGIIFWATAINPAWLTKGLLMIAALAEIVGIAILLPQV